MQPNLIRILLTLLLVTGAATTGCRSGKRDRDASAVSSGQTKKRGWGRDRRERREGYADDVFSVVCIYPANMWKSFDEAGDQNVEGFEFIVLLLSRETQKGAWSDGTLTIKMYTNERDANGRLNRDLVQTWTADAADLPQRTPSMTGYSYQPSISWGPDLDVYGRDVEIVVQFERPDGGMMRAQTKAARVPKRLE